MLDCRNVFQLKAGHSSERTPLVLDGCMDGGILLIDRGCSQAEHMINMKVCTVLFEKPSQHIIPAP